jgi:hypothetical protein
MKKTTEKVREYTSVLKKYVFIIDHVSKVSFLQSKIRSKFCKFRSQGGYITKNPKQPFSVKRVDNPHYLVPLFF